MTKNSRKHVQFVSILFQYNEDHVQKWREFPFPVSLYVPDDQLTNVQTILQDKKHITLNVLPPVNKLPWFYHDTLKLPEERNTEKDTEEYLWYTHQKVFCCHDTMNRIYCTHLAYLDFHVLAELIHNENTLTYLQSLIACRLDQNLFVDHEQRMYIPGCWETVDDVETQSFVNHVCWRFCGSFFFGSKVAIQDMYELYCTYFLSFVEKSQSVLTWEVNFWAYLEKTVKVWEPVWYPGNHDDTMLLLPDVFLYKTVQNMNGTKIHAYDYPILSPYRPMSSSYVQYLGKSYLNTRCVNYWLHDNGGYYYPDDDPTILTLNVCSRLNDRNIPMDYSIMENPLNFIHEEYDKVKPSLFVSKGIEDIRLYVSASTGELCFIGTTMVLKDNGEDILISMIQGNYDIENKCCRSVSLIHSPYNEWCEKNWSHIPLPSGKDGFIYKWHPYEIGTIEQKPDDLSKKQLIIETTYETPKWFSKMKGSTPFVPYKDNLLGVVHFSYDKSPRQYFNQLIMINKTTMKIMECSNIFCFLRPSIEFCIGFTIIDNHNDSKFGFWISQMDRDPLYLEANVDHFRFLPVSSFC